MYLQYQKVSCDIFSQQVLWNYQFGSYQLKLHVNPRSHEVYSICVLYFYEQSNRLRKIEGLDALVNLEEFYASNNGIQKVEGLENNVSWCNFFIVISTHQNDIQCHNIRQLKVNYCNISLKFDKHLLQKIHKFFLFSKFFFFSKWFGTF